MRRAWTSDMHVGNGNIIEYAGRPFRDAAHMNKRLVDGANERLLDGDTCVHVGDFCFGGRKVFNEFCPKLRGNWVFVRGNHDQNNGAKTVCDWMFTRMSHFTVFVSHVPYFYRHEEGTAKFLLSEAMIAEVEARCDFAICGHVHDEWDVSDEGEIPCFNVSVDVRKFRPIFDNEIVLAYNKFKNGN